MVIYHHHTSNRTQFSLRAGVVSLGRVRVGELLQESANALESRFIESIVSVDVASPQF
jgi:hypothetical protein